MAKSRLPKSIRKFIRQEKARLRRQILDREEAERKIKELVAVIRQRYTKEYAVEEIFSRQIPFKAEDRCFRSG